MIISIVGCGWLGLPLAGYFLPFYPLIKGSSTQQQKCDFLYESGVESYLFSTDESDSYQVLPELLDATIVIFTIPFKRSLEDPHTYTHAFERILSVLPSTVEHVIFSSSTSVYPPGQHWDESMAITPQTERQRALLATEQLIEDLPCPSTVLRFAGLVGPDRHPGRWLHKEQVIERGNQPVNLVHLRDCMQSIERVIQERATGIFNICADKHPLKREFYRQAAQDLGLVTPTFHSNAKASDTKIILNDKSKDSLNMSYIFPDPLGFEYSHDL